MEEHKGDEKDVQKKIQEIMVSQTSRDKFKDQGGQQRQRSKKKKKKKMKDTNRYAPCRFDC